MDGSKLDLAMNECPFIVTAQPISLDCYAVQHKIKFTRIARFYPPHIPPFAPISS